MVRNIPTSNTHVGLLISHWFKRLLSRDTLSTRQPPGIGLSFQFPLNLADIPPKFLRIEFKPNPFARVSHEQIGSQNTESRRLDVKTPIMIMLTNKKRHTQKPIQV